MILIVLDFVDSPETHYTYNFLLIANYLLTLNNFSNKLIVFPENKKMKNEDSNFQTFIRKCYGPQFYSKK